MNSLDNIISKLDFLILNGAFSEANPCVKNGA